ncbi:MAG: hypothetical protein ACLRZ9_11420 [Eubacterium sp.]
MDKFDIPNIAKGTAVPDSVLEKQLAESKKKSELKSQRRHDWLIAIFNVFGGFIGGIISSLIVMYIKGLL